MRTPPTRLDTFFPYRLAVAAEGFSRQLAAVYGAGFGLSREEWRLLFLLAGEGAVTSPDLTRRTTLDRVQLSRASQRLEDKGLITRKVSPDDRRMRIYACTDAGAALFAAALPQVERRAAEVLDTIAPQDRAALEQGLAALSRALAGAARPHGADDAEIP